MEAAGNRFVNIAMGRVQSGMVLVTERIDNNTGKRLEILSAKQAQLLACRARGRQNNSVG